MSRCHIATHSPCQLVIPITPKHMMIPFLILTPRDKVARITTEWMIGGKIRAKRAEPSEPISEMMSPS